MARHWRRRTSEMRIGLRRVHVCGLCGALTRASPADTLQHARYHVVFDRETNDPRGDQPL